VSGRAECGEGNDATEELAIFRDDVFDVRVTYLQGIFAAGDSYAIRCRPSFHPLVIVLSQKSWRLSFDHADVTP
jgi:uncharacterized UPF0146 family protein